MEQSQTPGDLVQHPEYDGKKTLLVLKEKLTREGLDDSMILVKLKEAHDAIQRACDACMVTDEDDKQFFWDDHTFSKYYYYWLENVRITMQREGSSDSEVSDAEKKARRAIFAAKKACTTDTDRAELLRIEGDEIPFEDVVYQSFDADDAECGHKDKVAALHEQLIRAGADESEISTRLSEAEAAIQRIFSACVFTDKEKQIFRHDINGKYTEDLLTIMLFRLKKLGHDDVTVEEMTEAAYHAMVAEEYAFRICVPRHQTDDEKDGGSSKRPRMN